MTRGHTFNTRVSVDGIIVHLHLHAEVIYARSEMHMSGETRFAHPTHDEIAAGYAERTIELTATQVWHNSTCLDCGLPLPLHPDKRRRNVKRRYCNAAREMAKR